MQVDSCCSRNWNVWQDLLRLQETGKQFDLCAPGGLQVTMMVCEPVGSGREADQDADNHPSAGGGILGK